ncbi:hypothetical protein HK405_006242 [Cladochytrium tenue]|nr:hypothetical protein HK405_006242 [Cladochytrium tenue]
MDATDQPAAIAARRAREASGGGSGGGGGGLTVVTAGQHEKSSSGGGRLRAASGGSAGRPGGVGGGGAIAEEAAGDISLEADEDDDTPLSSVRSSLQVRGGRTSSAGGGGGGVGAASGRGRSASRASAVGVVRGAAGAVSLSRGESFVSAAAAAVAGGGGVVTPSWLAGIGHESAGAESGAASPRSLPAATAAALAGMRVTAGRGGEGEALDAGMEAMAAAVARAVVAQIAPWMEETGKVVRGLEFSVWNMEATIRSLERRISARRKSCPSSALIAAAQTDRGFTGNEQWEGENDVPCGNASGRANGRLINEPGVSGEGAVGGAGFKRIETVPDLDFYTQLETQRRSMSAKRVPNAVTALLAAVSFSPSA